MAGGAGSRRAKEALGSPAERQHRLLDGLLFSLCDGDVSVVQVRTGELIATLQGRYDLSRHEDAEDGSGAPVASFSGSDAVAEMVARNGLDAEEDSVLLREYNEEIVMFAVHPGGQVVTVSRQLLLRHWVLDVKRSGKIFASDGDDTGQSQSKATLKLSPSALSRLQGSMGKRAVLKSLHRTAITASEYDTSGTLVATAGSERVIKVWDVRRGYCTHNLKLQNIATDTHRTVGGAGAVTAVRFHPDPHRLYLFACTEDDCAVRAWDLVTSSPIATFTEHMSAPTCLVFSEDGYTLATGGRDKVVNFMI